MAYTFYRSDGRVMRYNKALAARGDCVDVIALRERGTPAIMFLDGVRVTGVQGRSVTENSQLTYLLRILLFFLRAMILLSWRHYRSNYDVIHVHSVPDFLVFSAWLPKLLGAKIILDIHDLLPELYASKFNVSSRSLLSKALLATEYWSIAFADHVITANELWHKRLLTRAVSTDKATVLLNYPDRTIFKRHGRSPRGDRFIILYPGTLNWHQGLDIALEAFAMIKDSASNADFYIYGTGPALPALRQQAEALGLSRRVYFKDRVPLHEIARVMENADLAVVPKRNNAFGDEAFSTKVLEFMSVGVPVIVADTKIDLHYFDASVVTFFRGGNVADLAKAMLALISDPVKRASLVEHGLAFAQYHSWESHQHVYLTLVDRLATAAILPPPVASC